MELINNLVEYFTKLLQDGGLIFGILLILLESVIPALPLGVFVALNINAYGIILGIIVSWLSTCLGCYLSFLLFSLFSNRFLNRMEHKKKLKKIIAKMRTINFSNLVVLIALPFTPAFAINIAAGLVGLDKRKFLVALVTGKIFMISFWGLVGKSLIESLTDISSLIIAAVLIIIAYFLSKLISKKMKIE